MMKRYLVTGGAGFIGGVLAQALKARGHHVTILDLENKIRTVSLDPAFEVIPASVAEASTYAILSRLPPFDAVFHLAAQSSARVSHEQPELDIDTNAKGTLLMAQWCSRPAARRLLYTSSMAVYGEPETLPIAEDTLPHPVSFYGVSKLAGEFYIRAHERLGLNHTIFRLFNVYGPGQDMANLKQGMASIYLAYVAKGLEVPVTGHLDRFRDFIYVDDVVNAFLLAVDHPTAYNRIYNLGSGKRTTVRELLDVIIRAWGSDPAVYPVKLVEGHPGDQFGAESDSRRFSRDFGWTAGVDLQEGIKRMVAWLKTTQQKG